MDLAAALNQAEQDDLLWALLVEHADGQVEILGWDGSAGLVADLEGTEQAMGEWLLVPEPVACDEAAAAQAPYFLHECSRCDLGN